MKNIHPALKFGLWVVVPTELVKACMLSTYFLKSLPLLVLKYTELVTACVVSTYFLKSLPLLVLKYTH
jgi:hypothetical protein